MAYTVKNPPTAFNEKSVRGWAFEEFREIEKALQSGEWEFLRMKEWHEAPQKVFTGLTVLADGTDWDPGSGQGVYTYYAGTWHKLG